MSDPKAFLHVPRVPETRRPVAARIQDWEPVYVPATPAQVARQASRCMGCGVPFCQSGHGCPVENLIPDWNELVVKGDWRQGLEALHETNNFPEFTGHLCPAPCEAACVLGLNEAPVTIKQVEASLIERGFAEGWVQPAPPTRILSGRVAVVGSGPAGLAAAQQLRRAGLAVTVLERADRLGGLLRYGIPDFKMAKSVLDRRLAQLAAEGVEFQTGVDVGKTVSLAELSRRYDAVCLTVGAERPRDLAVPGRELGGIHFAMDYLRQQNRRNAGDAVPGQIDAAGKRVVILGGGDTGADCLGTAIRQGCEVALQFEVRDRPPLVRGADRPWPLMPMTLLSSHAHEEGGTRLWNVATTGFSGVGGQVHRLHAVNLQMEGGQPTPVAGSEFTVEADLVLIAIGFTGVDSGFAGNAPLVACTTAGTVATDRDYATNVPGIFAAGDARRGASLIVWAIAEGRRMAAAVERYLTAGMPAVPVGSLRNGVIDNRATSKKAP